MPVDRDAGKLQADRVAVDQRQHPDVRERVAGADSRRGAPGQLAAAQRERGVERELSVPAALDVDREAPAGSAGSCAVDVVHAHERRHVQRLGDVSVSVGKDVRAPLAPRRVRDLGEDCLHSVTARVQAVVEAHRVEAVPERAELGEEPDGPIRP